MNIPTVHGTIARRILVNYQADPEVLAHLLPAPFRPKLVNGVGVAGVCLLRLQSLRPRFAPAFLGLTTENAAHRIAVVWDDTEGHKEGVYIPRRDTNSRWNTLLGGTVFPGEHHHATFAVSETATRFRVSVDSDDRLTHVAVAGRLATDLPASSVFGSVAEASAFFENGALGYSATHDPRQFEGLELRTRNWKVEPLEVERVESSFFEDRHLFPEGSARFDCALLMRGIEHEWRARGELCS
ncbi:MAG: DUF2071 domain-containing protein [Chloroflexia bacterium]